MIGVEVVEEMSRPKRKGFTVRKRKDCDRWELIIHPDRRLDLPMLYNGLYLTREEAEMEGWKAVGLGPGREEQKDDYSSPPWEVDGV